MTRRAIHERERTESTRESRSFAPFTTGLQSKRTNQERMHSFVFGSFAGGSGEVAVKEQNLLRA
jgi:hypothetical protein